MISFLVFLLKKTIILIIFFYFLDEDEAAQKKKEEVANTVMLDCGLAYEGGKCLEGKDVENCVYKTSYTN